MDWLKIALSAYLVLYVVGVAGYVAMVGRPREPITPGTAGCAVTFNFAVFVMLCIIWTRL